MMRLAATLALIAAVSLPPGATTAGAGEATEAKLSRIFRAFGYEEVFRGFGPAIAVGVTAAEDRPEVARQLREAAERSFDPESALARIVARTDAALAPEATEAVFTFYESPFGRKVAALERSVIQEGMSAAAPGAAACCGDDLEEALAALPAAEAAAPERFALYRRLIAAILAEARMLEFANAVLVATLTGVVAGDPGAAGALDAMIRSATEATRAIFAESYERLGLRYAHDSFGTLEIGELERLVETLESPESAAFYGAVNDAVTAVVSEDSRRFGERMGAILRENGG